MNPIIQKLRRFLLSDFGPAPLPDLEAVPSFELQKIVETIYSESKCERVFVTLDDSGTYRLWIERWDTSDWSAGYGARWTQSQVGSITDNLPRARELARETLKSWGSPGNGSEQTE